MNEDIIRLEQKIEALQKQTEAIVDLLQANGQKPEQEGITEEVMNIGQVAKFLSLKVPTIYGLVQRAEIPFNKHKKRLYFLKSEIVEWIKAHRRKTVAEIRQDAGLAKFR